MPVVPSNGNNGNGFFSGDGIWAIIIFAIIFGWGGFGNGFGFGGVNNGGVMDGYILNSDFAQVESKLDSISNGICSLGYDQLAQMNGINQNITNTGYAIQNAIQQDTIAGMQNANALQSQLADCCCQNREAIANLNYNLATQSCETKQAIADSTRSILDFLTQDKIASLTAENQSLKFLQSQTNQNALLTGAMAAQTSQLINAINPTAQPAYIVPNPNVAYGCGCNTCGC